MFPEPVKVIRVVPMGGSIKLVEQGRIQGWCTSRYSPLPNLRTSKARRNSSRLTRRRFEARNRLRVRPVLLTVDRQS